MNYAGKAKWGGRWIVTGVGWADMVPGGGRINGDPQSHTLCSSTEKVEDH